MTDELELVQFMTAEIGDDFIVSFFVANPHDPTDGRSIILMRGKKWEHPVAELERGVAVSDEGFPENEEADNDYLEGIRISNTVAEIESTRRRYKPGLRHVGKSEVKVSIKVLKKMNYDRQLKLTII